MLTILHIPFSVAKKRGKKSKLKYVNSFQECHMTIYLLEAFAESATLNVLHWLEFNDKDLSAALLNVS